VTSGLKGSFELASCGGEEGIVAEEVGKGRGGKLKKKMGAGTADEVYIARRLGKIFIWRSSFSRGVPAISCAHGKQAKGSQAHWKACLFLA